MPRPAAEPRLARLAAQIAEPARSRMLAYLLDGHVASAGELARAGGVAPSTASAHLARLCDAGLLAAESRGRHRYFKLADAEVAHALEALALVAERDSHRRLWDSPQRAPMRYARCCYGHLAGTLGVMLMEALQRGGRLRPTDDGWTPSEQGRAWLLALGLAWPEAGASRQRAREAYGCLDWSERRDHLAGALATALLEHFIASGWLRRDESPAQGRALTLTPTGQRRLLPAMQA